MSNINIDSIWLPLVLGHVVVDPDTMSGLTGALNTAGRHTVVPALVFFSS